MTCAGFKTQISEILGAVALVSDGIMGDGEGRVGLSQDLECMAQALRLVLFTESCTERLNIQVVSKSYTARLHQTLTLCG